MRCARCSGILAVEPDAEMATVGEAWARRKGLTQLRYVVARAELLGKVDLGQFELVTFGQSFHWTARHDVAALASARLVPGGGIALIAHQHVRRPQPDGPDVPLIPHDAMHAHIRRYLGPARRAGVGYTPNNVAGFDEEAVLARAGFVDIERLYCPGREDLVCDIDTVVAIFLSMSFAAPQLFGLLRTVRGAQRTSKPARSLLRMASHASRYCASPPM